MTAADHGRRVPSGRTLVRATLTQAALEVRLQLRSYESLVLTLGIPLGVLVFFSAVDVLPTDGEDPVRFLVPGVLAISVMSSGLVALAIQTAFERKYGVLKRLGGTPLPRTAFLVAKALSVVAVIAVQTVLVVLVATVGLDWAPTGGVAAVLVAMLLGAFTFSALGLLMAGSLRAEATLGLANAVYLVLLLISGVMFARDALPGPVAAIGGALPSGALGTALRAALDGPGGFAGSALAVLAGWGAVATIVAGRTFRWEP